MKDLFFTALIVCLLVLGSLFLTQTATAMKDESPATVQSVDLKKYAGLWYEIARYPNKFQKECIGNVTAEYVLQSDDDITVVNKCREEDGEIETAKGEARIADRKTNAKLEVRFAPKFLSFIPQVWGDYWILDLGENYDYALVGSPDRKYLWVLSRSPQIEEAKYESILQTAKQEGFDPARLIKTEQK